MGEDPFSKTYIQSAMREHFMDCCEKLPFPTSTQSRRLVRERKLCEQKVNVFCKCRLPWDKTYGDKGTLVNFSMCREWFHEICMKIDKKVIDQPLMKYDCDICLDL